MSGLGNGYLSGNMLIPFPFEDGRVLAWSGMAEEAQIAFQRCFVDAFIHVEGTPSEGDPLPYAGMFSIDDGGISFEIFAGESHSSVSARPSAERFPYVYGKTEWGSYAMTFSSEGIRDFLAFCSENSISPPAQVLSPVLGQGGALSLRFCPRCVSFESTGVSSLMVYDGVHPKDEGPHFVLKGDVAVKPGNNMMLSEPDGDEVGFVLRAIPGAGFGKIPCEDAGCEDEGYVSQIVGPDGHARLFNDTCYDLEPFVIERGKLVELRMHAKCTACCTCDMYESIVNDRLSALFSSVKSAKDEIAGQLETYEDAVDRFNMRLSKPSIDDMSASLTGMPLGSKLGSNVSGGVKGRMNRCALSAVFRNSSYFPVLMTITEISGTDSVEEVSVSWTDKNGISRSTSADSSDGIIGQTFEVLSGRSLAVTFVAVKNAMSSSVSTGGYSGAVAAEIAYIGKDGKRASLGVIKKTAEVA